MNTYADADAWLTGRGVDSDKLQDGTVVLERMGHELIGLRHGDTYIVIFTPEYSMLQLGNAIPVTRAFLINQYLPRFVFVDKRGDDWIIRDRGKVRQFFDGVKIHYEPFRPIARTP